MSFAVRPTMHIAGKLGLSSQANLVRCSFVVGWFVLDPHENHETSSKTCRNLEDDEEAKRGVAAARAVAPEGQRTAPWRAEDAAGAAVETSAFG